MVQLADLRAYLDVFLDARRFTDYAPNGLQVEGKAQIGKLVTGVTASQLFLDAAVDAGADAVLVHHGYFWKGDDPCLVGFRQRRMKTLLANNLSLLAYHLPLDAHAVYGNNAQLAKVLDIVVEGFFPAPAGMESLAFQGCFARSLSPNQLVGIVTERLRRKPLYVPGPSAEIRTIGWCTGAGQDLIEYAARAGLDAYLTGEVSERTVHVAREMGIHFFAAGHHATERYGIEALGAHLGEKFGISCEFIDMDNPV